jgi:hypothetical protein
MNLKTPAPLPSPVKEYKEDPENAIPPSQRKPPAE